MKEHNVSKIIDLLEGADQKNILLGLNLMESLGLKQDVFDKLHGENLLPQNIQHNAKATVTFYFNNRQISCQCRQAYLEFYDKLTKFMLRFNDDIKVSQRIFDTINTAFFMFAGKLKLNETSALQILSYEAHHYVLFKLKTSWVYAMNFHKQIKALQRGHHCQQNQDDPIKWTDLAEFCQEPLYYQLSSQSEELVDFELLLRIKK